MHASLLIFFMYRMCVYECGDTRSSTHVGQTSDKDEGPRRVWPGQLVPDLAYLAEARCHFHCRGAMLGLLHGLELLTKHRQNTTSNTQLALNLVSKERHNVLNFNPLVLTVIRSQTAVKLFYKILEMTWKPILRLFERLNHSAYSFYMLRLIEA